MKKEILPIVYKNNKSDIWRKVIFFYLPLFLLLAILGITISCFVGLKIKWGIIGLIVTIIMWRGQVIAKKLLKNGNDLRKLREKLLRIQIPYKGYVKKIIHYYDNDSSYSTYTMLVECDMDGVKHEFESLEYSEELNLLLASPLVDVYYNDDVDYFFVENLSIGPPCDIEVISISETDDSTMKREERQSYKKDKSDQKRDELEDDGNRKKLYEAVVIVFLMSLAMFFWFEFSDDFVFTGTAPLIEKLIYGMFFSHSLLFACSLFKRTKKFVGVLGYLILIEWLLVIYLMFKNGKIEVAI